MAPGVAAGIFRDSYANTMTIDALGPCVVSPSAAMLYTGLRLICLPLTIIWSKLSRLILTHVVGISFHGLDFSYKYIISMNISQVRRRLFIVNYSRYNLSSECWCNIDFSLPVLHNLTHRQVVTGHISYPSETHLKLKSREISVVSNILVGKLFWW